MSSLMVPKSKLQHQPPPSPSPAPSQVVLGLCIIFVYSWRLSLVMLSVVPAIAVTAVIYASYVKRISKDYQTSLAEASDCAQQESDTCEGARGTQASGRT